jgi:kynurenine formamidase
MPRFIDLSLPLEESPSEPRPLRIIYGTHEQSAHLMAGFVGAAISDLPGGYGFAGEEISASSHSATHVDAPWHYYPTSGGAPARTIDQIPLDWFYGDGVVLDMRHKERGGLITVADLQDALETIGYTIKPRDIVLMQTDSDKLWGSPEYPLAGAGMSGEAVRWLVQQGVRVMGSDAYAWDQPFYAMRQRLAQTGDPSVIFEAHRVGAELEYCQIDRLANLDLLPRPFGFTLICFPVKVRNGSAGWARVVALFPD